MVDQKTGNAEKLRDVTLLFLIKKDEGQILEICLAMKKRGFGANRWNGAGGKVEKGEQIEEAAIREAREEIGVEAKDLSKVGELDFHFPHMPAYDQKVHVYFSQNWTGEPTESEEMKPDWFAVRDIPYDSMWQSDSFWFPKVIAGKRIRSSMVFNENDTVVEQQMEEVDSF